MDKQQLRQFLKHHMQQVQPIRRQKTVPTTRTYRKRERAEYDQTWRAPTQSCAYCGQIIDQSHSVLYYQRTKKRWIEYGHDCLEKLGNRAK